MAESPDFKDLLLALNKCGVEYLVIGGYAVMRYSEPRFTKDLDIWVGNSVANSARVFDALALFGAPLTHDGIVADTFARDHTVYQIGVPPVRIDILTSISGCSFEAAWERRNPGVMYGLHVHFISLPDLIANKKAAG